MARLYFYLMPVVVLLLCIDQSIAYTEDPEASVLGLVSLWLCWFVVAGSCIDSIRVSRRTELIDRFPGSEVSK